MLVPKKVKHRKWHKPRRRNKGVATRTNTVAFGLFGMKSLGHAWITSRQIEAARRVLTRYVRKEGKVYIRIFPDRPVTKKGSEVPMGGGKGSPDHFVCTVKPGTILFEMSGVTQDEAFEAFRQAGQKLPIKIRPVTKEEV